MNGAHFDVMRCGSCGVCGEICPMGVITSSAGIKPFVSEERRVLCVQCGHCEAVCPANAIRVSNPELQDDSAVMERPNILAAQIRAYFRNRRSIRTYKQEPVDKKTLDQVFDIVRFAPSGMNQQGVQWLVLYDTRELLRLKGLAVEWMRQMVKDDSPLASSLGFSQLIESWDKGIDRVGRNAPHMVLACGHKDNRLAPTNGTIALSHLELLAPAFGLGACWAGYFRIAASNSPLLAKELGIPETHTCLGAMMMGYPKHSYQRVPKRKPVSLAWK